MKNVLKKSKNLLISMWIIALSFFFFGACEVGADRAFQKNKRKLKSQF